MDYQCLISPSKAIVEQDTAGRQAKENNNTEKSEGEIKH
jgi:hypothetical protein